MLSRTDGPICIILLDRPECHNVADSPTATTLLDAFERLKTDGALRVAVLGGADGRFCADTDLTAVGDPSRHNHLDPDGGIPSPMGPPRVALPKPLIAAISGYAATDGLGLALLADLHVMERDAVFGMFCHRWGVPLIDGGTVCLSRIVGMGRTLDMVLAGHAVPADEALAVGPANRVAGPGEALAMAQKLTRDIAAFPRQCVLADRASAYTRWDSPLATALQQEGARGMPTVFAGGVGGAARFVGGAGRLGE